MTITADDKTIAVGNKAVDDKRNIVLDDEKIENVFCTESYRRNQIPRF